MIATTRAGPPTGGRTHLGRWRIGFIAACAVVAITGLALGRHGHPFAGVTTGVLAVAAILYGISVLRPSRARAWALLAIAVALLAAEETFAGLSHTFGDRFPAPTDVATVVDYLPLAVAVLWIGHPPSARQHVTTALDAAVLSLAATLLAWIGLVRPTIARLNLDALGRDLIIVDWATDIATVAIAVLLIMTWRANRAALLLGGAIVALLASDVVQGIDLLNGITRETTIDGGFLLFCVLAGLAALHPAMAHITSVGTTQEQLSLWRLIALAAALLIPPIVLLNEATHGPVHAAVAIATIAAIIGLLMLARVTVGARALRERTTREQALREATGLLGAVQTSNEVATVLSTAARSMMPAGNTAASLLAADTGPTEILQLRETLGGTGYLRIPIALEPSDATDSRPPPGEIRFSGPATRLFALKPAMTTLAEQAGNALQRISLAEAVREHQRDSYFRTLVQNSSDVILICRNGIVDYETPAARDLFATGTAMGSKVDDLIAESPTDSNPDSGSTDATVDGGDGPRRVRVRRRDLTDDPTIRGVVLTLHDITEQQRLHDKLAYQATHDSLTGLPNRQLLRDRLRTARDRTNARARSAALFIDLDNLKEVNDTLGHAAGDELLTIAADRIVGCLRHDDLAVRLGGDEFAVLLSSLPTAAAAWELAERVVEAFRRPVQLREASVNCTVSLGLADARGPEEFHTLLHRADTALYAAKAAGKNTWREHHVDLPEPTQIGPASAEFQHR